jgi:hypothetical protein
MLIFNDVSVVLVYCISVVIGISSRSCSRRFGTICFYIVVYGCCIMSGHFYILRFYQPALFAFLAYLLSRHHDGAIFKNNFPSADNLLTRTLEVLSIV